MQYAPTSTIIFLVALERFCADLGVALLIVQPPDETTFLAKTLAEKGFMPLGIDTSPSATIHINLGPDEEAIFNRFSKDLRQNIRQSLKSKIKVRLGNRADIPSFYKPMQTASRRLKYPIQTLEYYLKLWDLFTKDQKIILFLSECQGRIVSGKLSLIFRDLIVDKRFGWSGECANMHPNELLDWESIRWAKGQGLRYYDLEGIDYDVAFNLLKGKSKSEIAIMGPDSYKLKFGGAW